MDNRFLVATLAGGLTLFVLGGLTYGLAFASFFESNSAAGIMRDSPLFLSVALGQVLLAAVLTLVIGESIPAPVDVGLKRGAVVGLLLIAGFDLTLFGTSTAFTFAGAVADIALFTLLAAAAGAVISVVLSRW